MGKLNQGELLKRLRNWWMSLDKAWPSFQLSWTTRDQQAYQKIIEIIKLHFSDDWQQVKKDLGKFMQKQKPEVTEEWIEKKAAELLKLIGYKIHGEYLNVHIGNARDFIQSLVEEIHGRKEDKL